MSGKGLARLRLLLAERYDILKAQVAYRLGSSNDMAGDALHDAYVRLAGRDDLDRVRYPQTYLINAAVNSAIDRIRGDVRLVGEDEVSALFELADEAPGPERTLDGRDRMQRVLQVLAELPPRQCALLVAYRVHGTQSSELAKRWGISKVMVRREIQAAHHYCLAAMEKREGKGGQL